MSENAPTPEDRATRGKRLLFYGMFALVVVTFLSVFLSLYFLTGWVTGNAGFALQTAFLISIITLVACVIVWFVYTKFIVKD